MHSLRTIFTENFLKLCSCIWTDIENLTVIYFNLQKVGYSMVTTGFTLSSKIKLKRERLTFKKCFVCRFRLHSAQTIERTLMILLCLRKSNVWAVCFKATGKCWFYLVVKWIFVLYMQIITGFMCTDANPKRLT